MGTSTRCELERFMGHVKTVAKSKDCWLWTGYLYPNGYGSFNSTHGINCAHRISYELFISEIPEGMFVCHHCDNPKCVRPSHLFLGTQADNMTDKKDKKRHNYGENHYATKLTDHQVSEIRKSNLTQQKIASKYGVSRGYISELKSLKKRITQ